MHTRWIVYCTVVMAGAVAVTLLRPAQVGAVGREIVDLKQGMEQLIQAQKDLSTVMTQDHAAKKTLIELSIDSVNRLGGTMDSMQKSAQDAQTNSGDHLDAMSTQTQKLFASQRDMLERISKLNQQLADSENSLRSIDAKLANRAPSPAAVSHRNTPARNAKRKPSG